MNQTTAFNPNLVVKLLDDRVVRFKRSDGDHWAAICEEIKAPKSARLRAELDAAKDVKPLQRLQLIEDIDDMEIVFEEAQRLCIHTPKWLKVHLSKALEEAGTPVADIPGVLALIPFAKQQEIAHTIAMLPVVKNDKVGTDANPLAVGTDYAVVEAELARLVAEEKARALTGGQSPPPSGDAIPVETPAA